MKLKVITFYFINSEFQDSLLVDVCIIFVIVVQLVALASTFITIQTRNIPSYYSQRERKRECVCERER